LARPWFEASIFLFVACCCIPAWADIVGPYSLDTNTLHLWHVDESAVPGVDSAPNGTNLLVLADGATLNNGSYGGFGKSYSTA